MPVAADSVYVTWTMDCEIIAEEVPSGGPVDWDQSERAMRGYVDALAARGHRATLFLIPRLAEKQPEIVLELGAAGADLGMHMHPETIDYGHDHHLGQLSPAIQEILLRTGRDRVAEALGQAPTSFRPGCFSASDHTLPILWELGFTQGSVSLPGRASPQTSAL